MRRRGASPPRRSSPPVEPADEAEREAEAGRGGTLVADGTRRRPSACARPTDEDPVGWPREPRPRTSDAAHAVPAEAEQRRGRARRRGRSRRQAGPRPTRARGCGLARSRAPPAAAVSPGSSRGPVAEPGVEAERERHADEETGWPRPPRRATVSAGSARAREVAAEPTSRAPARSPPTGPGRRPGRRAAGRRGGPDPGPGRPGRDPTWQIVAPDGAAGAAADRSEAPAPIEPPILARPAAHDIASRPAERRPRPCERHSRRPARGRRPRPAEPGQDAAAAVADAGGRRGRRMAPRPIGKPSTDVGRVQPGRPRAARPAPASSPAQLRPVPVGQRPVLPALRHPPGLIADRPPAGGRVGPAAASGRATLDVPTRRRTGSR